MIRILAGGPSRCTGEAHEVAWMTCIQRQVPPGVEVEFRDVFAGDDAADDYEVGPVEHAWTATAIHRVAQARQRFVDDARTEGFDAVWMVDDDVLCGPGVLGVMAAVMIEHQAPVVVGVYYTPGWLPQDPARELPQVWDRHPYSIDAATVEDWRGPIVRQINGGGACTLIDLRHRRSVPGALYWPPIRGLEHWGEDRWACIRWAEAGALVLGVGGLPIAHAYQPSERAEDRIRDTMGALWPDGVTR